ncbi:MAG: hypothetical protein M3371_12980 [Acidobacteriota bacterium]|nr:hypothetical protein [Acidobacteriota bacterium]
MKNFLTNIRRASPLAGLVPLCSFALALSLLPTSAAAQTDKQTQVSDSIFGVSIEANLNDVRPRLDQFGASGGRNTRDGGRKEAWTLKETDFSYVAVRADSKGKIVWVSGFLRPGKEIPFAKLGDLALAKGATDTQAIWNVETSGGGYRLVAKGQHGKATVIYLLSLATPPVQ